MLLGKKWMVEMHIWGYKYSYVLCICVCACVCARVCVRVCVCGARLTDYTQFVCNVIASFSSCYLPLKWI